jgi:hypothetical protein
MFFTKAGRTIAWLCVAGSVLHYGYLQVFAFQQGGILPGHPKWDSLSAASLKDMQLFAFGVAIGILAEISRSLASLAQSASIARNADGMDPKK